jgi:hypothetical protein
MPSEISGLPSLRGYLKLENLVVRLRFPFSSFRRGIRVRGTASDREAAAGNVHTIREAGGTSRSVARS